MSMYVWGGGEDGACVCLIVRANGWKRWVCLMCLTFCNRGLLRTDVQGCKKTNIPIVFIPNV